MVFQFVQKNEKPDYLVGGKWSLFTKACNEYRKAELMCDEKKMKKLAQKINLLQVSLGLTKTNFPILEPEKIRVLIQHGRIETHWRPYCERKPRLLTDEEIDFFIKCGDVVHILRKGSDIDCGFHL